MSALKTLEGVTLKFETELPVVCNLRFQFALQKVSKS